MKYKNPDSKTAKNKEHVLNLIVFLAVFCRNKNKLVQIKRRCSELEYFLVCQVIFTCSENVFTHVRTIIDKIIINSEIIILSSFNSYLHSRPLSESLALSFLIRDRD